MIRDRGQPGRHSLLAPGRGSPDYCLQNAGDMLVLPPLGTAGKLSGKLQQNRGLGGTEMWTPLSSLHVGASQSRFRQWDLGREDFNRQLDVFGDTGNTQHTLTAKPHNLVLGRRETAQKETMKPRRKKSALGLITAAYLGSSSSKGGVDDVFDKLSALCGSSQATSEDDDGARLQRELAALRTGEDAVRYFAAHGSNAKIKILHCNRNSDADASTYGPYSLVVVPENKVHADHFTISASGVLHVCPGEMSECIPLSEWMHHSLMFSVLSTMPFFKMYSYRKNFGHWRANARYEAYCRQRHRLARSCLLAKPAFVQHLVRVHCIADEVKNVPVLHLEREKVRLEQFAETQGLLGSSARARLAEKHDAILQVLGAAVKSVTTCCEELPAQPSLSVHRRSKSKSMVQEKQEARDRMRRKQIIAEDIDGLGKFIRLSDLMLQSALVSVVLHAAVTLRTRLNAPQSLFSVSASFNHNGVLFDPSRAVFTEALRRYWDHVLQTASSVPSFSTNSRLRDHASQAHAKQHWSVEDMLKELDGFSEDVASIEDGIARHLDAAMVCAKEQYMPFYRISEYGQAWDGDAFAEQNHTFESLTHEMKLLCNFKSDMESFRAQRTVGLISVQAADLRENLNDISETALVVIRQMLVKLAQEQCARALREVAAGIKASESRPANRDECVKLVQGIGDQLRVTDKVGEQIDEAYKLLKQTRGKVPVEDQTQLDVLQAKWHELAHTKLPQAKAYLESLGPDVMVTIDTSSVQEVDWSLTCADTGSSELASLRADLEQEVADGFKDALAGCTDVPSRTQQTLGRMSSARRASAP